MHTIKHQKKQHKDERRTDMNRFGYSIKVGLEMALQAKGLDKDIESIIFDKDIDTVAVLITIAKSPLGKYPMVAGNILGHSFFIKMATNNYMKVAEVIDDLFIVGMPDLTAQPEGGSKQ
jgi:hypothetical protein